jgi:hypothetical protein
VGTPVADPEPAGAPVTDAEPANVPSPTCNRTGSAGPTTPKIWVIGDSTASEYAPDRFPRTGWGQVLQEHFAPACATVRDRAISGRSSKSFFDEALGHARTSPSSWHETCDPGAYANAPRDLRRAAFDCE